MKKKKKNVFLLSKYRVSVGGENNVLFFFQFSITRLAKETIKPQTFVCIYTFHGSMFIAKIYILIYPNFLMLANIDNNLLAE